MTDFNSQVMLFTPADGFVVDAKDGPRPISCTINNIKRARTVMLRWVCEGHIRECPVGSQGPGDDQQSLERFGTHQPVPANHARGIGKGCFQQGIPGDSPVP